MAVEAGEANAKVAEQRCARTRRFISRVDAHLPTLADDECRRVFLDSQLDGWERRYARFVATEGASEPITDPAEPPQAADFLLTLGELAKRRSAIPTMAREPNMKDANAQNRLDSAIRSLLVAADQRCPTIIGQAHLLYHARETMRFDPERALIQLKSDAQDLCNAIADAEVAMKDTKQGRLLASGS